MIKLRPIALSLPFLALLPFNATAQDIDIQTGRFLMTINANPLRIGDDIWDRIRQGLQIREVNPEIIRQHENAYAANPAGLKRSLERSRKYLFHIMTEVEHRGMPTEIALLPVIESAFIPGAKSPVGASGLWQFMPATGKQYNLEQTWWYDGRRDIVESTNAALTYLEYLYGLFNDWSLALAAYNWGEGNVSKAIKRAEAAGLAPTYENLRMPKETRNYVPKLLAVRNILATPNQYGFKIEKLPNQPQFIAIDVDRHINIEIAAKLAEISVDDFKLLNPGYNLPVFAYKEGRKMLIPVEKLGKFEKNLNKWGNKPLMTWQVYMPEDTRSISSIASEYGMSVENLKNINNLRSDTLKTGQPILVATNIQSTTTDVIENKLIAATKQSDPLNIQLSANDNKTNDNSKTEIALKEKSNDFKTNYEPLLISSNTNSLVNDQEIQKVAEANSDIQVAASIESKTKLSGKITLANNDLEPNDEISTYAESNSSPNWQQEKPTVAKQSSEKAKIRQNFNTADISKPVNFEISQYTVQSGDTLYSIARRFNLTLDELKSLNNLTSDVAKLGQMLTLKETPNKLEANNTQFAKQAADVGKLRKVSGEYVVKKGDTVFSIAQKLGISHTDMKLPNSNKKSQLLPGQKIKIQGL